MSHKKSTPSHVASGTSLILSFHLHLDPSSVFLISRPTCQIYRGLIYKSDNLTTQNYLNATIHSEFCGISFYYCPVQYLINCN